MIDPRPYTYEYRKPRPNNPTFQSSNLYQSLYHLRLPSKNEYVLARQKLPSINQQNIKLPSKQPASYEYNPERYQPRENERFKQKSMVRQQSVNSKPQSNGPPLRSMSFQKEAFNRYEPYTQRKPASSGVQSNLSNYGQSLMKSSNLDRFSVYERQQKGFNIINFYPKQMSNSSLRMFPKLTLQDKLIERGKYQKN